jgi:hypothetical protein
MSDKVFEWTDETIIELIGAFTKEVLPMHYIPMKQFVEDFKKSKQPKEDKDWVVFTKGGFGFITWSVFEFKDNDRLGDSYYTEKGAMLFQTKEAAEEYILLNKPCLSVNEIISHVDIGGLCELRLKELAKTKINSK